MKKSEYIHISILYEGVFNAQLQLMAIIDKGGINFNSQVFSPQLLKKLLPTR